MAQPTKSTVTVDGTAFDAVSTSVAFSTPVTAPGVAEMGALVISVRVIVDFNDDTNLPFSALNSLFTLSNVVDRTKIKDMKIDFWKTSIPRPMCSAAISSRGGSAGLKQPITRRRLPITP